MRSMVQRFEAARRLFHSIREAVEVKRESWGPLYAHQATSALGLAQLFFAQADGYEEQGQRSEKSTLLKTHLGSVQAQLADLKSWLSSPPGRGRLEAVPLSFLVDTLQVDLPRQVKGGHPLVFKTVGKPVGDAVAWMFRRSIFHAVKVLVDNAVRATREGDRPAEPVVIEHGICPRGGRDHFVVRVRDRGRGLSEVDREHVLMRPYTRYAAQGSLGLGLLAAKDMALQHGGSLSHLPSVRFGAVFELVLPLEKRGQPREA